MKFFDVAVRSFNIEITNRCTLGCSECPRTGNPWVTENLTDLPLSILHNVFPLEARERWQGLRVNLCGAHGDCIYHRGFHDIARHLKAAGLILNIETNGSHRKLAWWERTCEILGDDDNITFSVDGLEDTNHLYRVNARWADISQAMRFCAPRVKTSWKFIVFQHNEHQLDEARALAREIGVHSLAFKKSGRFRADDPLATRNDDYIGVVTRSRRQVSVLTKGGAREEDFDSQVKILPKCRYGKDLAITARGYFYPCTSCESSDTTSWFYRNREHFDLRVHPMEQILRSPKWRELESLWERSSGAPQSCLNYCGVHQDYVAHYSEGSRRDRPNKPPDIVEVQLT